MRQCLDEAMLQSYFDGELSTKLMESATLHLASCATCAAAARELEEENALLSEAFALEYSDSVPTERLRRRVDAAIAGIQVARPVVQQPSAVSGFFSSLSSLFSFLPQRGFGYAALMVVLAFGVIFGLVKFRSSAPVKSANEPQVAVNIQPNPGPTATIVASNETVNPCRQASRLRCVVLRVRQSKLDIDPVWKGNYPKQSPVKLMLANVLTCKQLQSLIRRSKKARRHATSAQAEYERNLAVVDRAIAATRSEAKKINDPDAADFMFAAYQSKVDL